MAVLENRHEGIYCSAGDFYIDPRGKVQKAIITHAHSDHGRPGHASYLCSDSCKGLLKTRIGLESKVESVAFGETVKIGDAMVSFHPAGHILGSAQIRVEVKGQVWVVSGDYKPQRDLTCENFELVKCHGFISECTFGLPVYRWLPEEQIHREINLWWQANTEEKIPSILFAYSLGKAQRVLAGLDPSNGPILVHPAVDSFISYYQQAGVVFPDVTKVERGKEYDLTKAIILAPPAVEDSTWIRKFKNAKKAFASGWMAIRGARRRRNLDRGFVLSDHADWTGLMDVIQATGAEKVLVTHGNGDALSGYLCEQGIDCSVLSGASLRGEEE
jgi:putative mRNA 3-end processing factor